MCPGNEGFCPPIWGIANLGWINRLILVNLLLTPQFQTQISFLKTLEITAYIITVCTLGIFVQFWNRSERVARKSWKTAAGQSSLAKIAFFISCEHLNRFSFLANIFSTDVFIQKAVGHAVHQRDVQETASLNNYSVKQDVFTHCQALRPVYVRWEYNDAKITKSLGTDQNRSEQLPAVTLKGLTSLTSAFSLRYVSYISVNVPL
jgi:hypothetical protein